MIKHSLSAMNGRTAESAKITFPRGQTVLDYIITGPNTSLHNMKVRDDLPSNRTDHTLLTAQLQVRKNRHRKKPRMRKKINIRAFYKDDEKRHLFRKIMHKKRAGYTKMIKKITYKIHKKPPEDY